MPKDESVAAPLAETEEDLLAEENGARPPPSLRWKEGILLEEDAEEHGLRAGDRY